MENKTGRHLIALTGLLLLPLFSGAMACDYLAPGLPAPVPSTQPPPAVDSEPPEQLSLTDEIVDGGGWSTVKTFIGAGDETTQPFHISDTEWRISWTIDTEYPEYAVFDLFVYPEGRYGISTERISYSGSDTSNTNYIHAGGQSYYMKLVTANLRSWAIKVEECPVQAPLSTIQITYVNYKGRGYLKSRELGYTVMEADEYVEIKNQGDSWQDIGGWTLKNISKGLPSFTFPAYLPGYEYSIPYCVPLYSTLVHPGQIHPEDCRPPAHCVLAPHRSIRIYTGEVHTESGSFCFYYPPGDIWNNDEPDTAALYDCRGKEMSRKSYIIPTQRKVTAGVQ